MFALGLSTAAQATVALIAAPSPAPAADVAARARWGATGFEANMLDAGTALTATQLNPTGNPVWQVGEAYGFKLGWDWRTGTLTWQIDFNRDNSFASNETASFTKLSRAGQSYNNIRIDLNSRVAGVNGNGLDITSLAINGFAQSALSVSNGSSSTSWYASLARPFRAIEVTGFLTFRNTGGNGAFQQERPVMSIALADFEPVPEPASWAMLVAGFGLVGSALRRQRARRGYSNAPSWRSSQALRSTPPA